MAISTECTTYVTCAAVLYVKFVLATMIQAIKTFEVGGRPPEDKTLPLAKGNPVQTFGFATPSEDQSEKIQKAKVAEIRWRRIVQNDLESIPLALIVFGAGIMAKGNSVVQICVMVSYTAVRCFHTVAYSNALHPHRALCWLFGIIFIITGAANALYGAFFN
ncbi:Membrane-associated, eicosanoid/glutathione metabolism (MAPEG) protein [Plasmopara halstedii]|uniref:Microsomal glutathione S-transferase 1 n=1 Tax=Plasmopara halstedii TaxID=4781 RepID=A0A0N7L548_PLAHL|nr:Membrane-associated, eicosanoid/glutathione metabolism (MAPEG) protein [Plasmopara halstedii]CEG40475.1 Membrane-associated, eicosanoid/glutathione metabolism (MAPEG) protein [Plasmopara halstedii]|eukprot:XP_024576844.1 Membrane-associated, eicosanoid/glutathione metabolism (MAPEG) protein [Plasmopara halstedii]